MMYYNKKKMAVSILWVIIGLTLLILGTVGVISDSVFTAFGGAFLGVGIMQIIRNIKYQTDEDYREKIDIEYKDERNRYIRMKAWSWAGYLFIIGAAIVSIILYVAKMTLYGQIVSGCMCAVLALYWISYMVIYKKY